MARKNTADPKFVMAFETFRFHSGVLFRVYPLEDSLLLIRMGNESVSGVEIGRRGAESPGILPMLAAAKPIVAPFGVVIAIATVIVLKSVLQGGVYREIVGGIAILLIFMTIAGVVFLLDIRATMQRAKLLDTMNPEELLKEVERDPRNRLLKSSEIHHASLGEKTSDTKNPDVPPIPSILTFELRPKGKLMLRFEDRNDLLVAIKWVEELIGPDNLAINVAFPQSDR